MKKFTVKRNAVRMYETKRGKKITRAFYKTETGTVFTKKSGNLLRNLNSHCNINRDNFLVITVSFYFLNNFRDSDCLILSFNVI